jgi:hypothetical protein
MSIKPFDFRRIARTMPGVDEEYSRGRFKYRVAGNTFASLETNSLAVVRITPDQQAFFMDEAPETFLQVLGREGRLGKTVIRLDAADETIAKYALAAAWSNVAAKPPAQGLNLR